MKIGDIMIVVCKVLLVLPVLFAAPGMVACTVVGQYIESNDRDWPWTEIGFAAGVLLEIPWVMLVLVPLLRPLFVAG